MGVLLDSGFFFPKFVASVVHRIMSTLVKPKAEIDTLSAANLPLSNLQFHRRLWWLTVPLFLLSVFACDLWAPPGMALPFCYLAGLIWWSPYLLRGKKSWRRARRRC